MHDTRSADKLPAGRLVLRPGCLADLGAIERIAAASVAGITTLPPDLAALRLRLARSEHSFASEDAASGEETYLFVLEDRQAGRIVGTSGIAASAGFRDRFYSYRNDYLVHASETLGSSNRIHTLHLCHDLTGHSLLTSFYIEPAYEHTAAAQLLSRARLLYMAEFRTRFADRLAAESPGLCDEHGNCPFWQAVGQRFFDMSYPQAERLSGGRNKGFIAELMPHAPLYVPLLPESAQLAIGQLHPVAEVPFAILLDEGFEADTYVDIFDGGPTVEARFELLRSVRKNRRLKVTEVAADAVLDDPGWYLVANTASVGFRAALALGRVRDRRLSLSAETLRQLACKPGAAVRCVPLDLPAAPDEEGGP